MLGKQQAGVRSTSAQRAKQTLGTQSSQEFPALDPTMHCKFPASKFQPLQGQSPRAIPAQGAATRHTQSLDPNRRPYTTDRLLFTQQQNTIHSFQLVFRVQSHDAQRCVNSNGNRKTAMKFSNRSTQFTAHSARTHEHASSPPQATFETTSRQVPVHSFVRSPRFLRDKQSIFPLTNTNSQ